MTNPTHTPNPNRRLAGEQGFALLGVLILSTILLALGVFGTTSARIELGVAHNDVLYKQALAVAEAGLGHAVPLVMRDFSDGFNDDLSSSGTGGPLATVGSTATVGGHSTRFTAFGDASGDGYYVWVADNYDEVPDDPAADDDFRIRILSRGTVGSAMREVEAVLQGSSLFPRYGLFGDEGVDISGGAVVDSYDAAVGPYPNGSGDGGHVGSNGDIDLNGRPTTINGDAFAGGTVDPGSGTITGEVKESADPVDLELVPVCGPPYSSGAGIAGGDYSPDTGELRSHNGGSPEDITLSPGTYCFSSIVLSSGRSLTVTGPTIIYLTGPGDFTGGSLVNGTSTPRNLLILSSYASDTEGIKVSGGSDVRAAIYAPQTDVKITGNSDFFGAVVGKRLDIPGSAQIHYDEDVRKIPGSKVEVVNWRERRSL